MSEERPILLIEDNPDDEALALRVFNRSEIPNPVVVLRDGVEALEYLFGPKAESGGAKPALVLLDLKLPRLDGLELLRRIRADERTALVPVVVLTSSSEPRDIQESYRLGANSYIRKPVDFERFLEALGRIGGYWLSFNEPANGKGVGAY